MKPHGLILCGGQSTRMGQDKSLLNYHGKPQREHLTEVLTPFTDQVFWSVNEQQFEKNRLNGSDFGRFINDKFLNEGPLGGILSAFESHQNAAWLVVSCDLPRLSAETLRFLFQNRRSDLMATVFADSRPYPFVSIWEPAIFDSLKLFWERGGRSPVALLGTVPTHILEMPNPAEFLDVNDHETYQLISKT